jgi:metal-dependent amidase/aminoacylase/carboxypeptidase family protein
MENLKQGVPLIVLRKELHKYPEVSGKEVGTAKNHFFSGKISSR